MAIVDFSKKEYEIGDFVFAAVHFRESSVRTFVGRVVKINESSVSVVTDSERSWRDNPYVTTVLMRPERHLIIPEDVALRLNPDLLNAVPAKR